MFLKVTPFFYQHGYLVYVHVRLEWGVFGVLCLKAVISRYMWSNPTWPTHHLSLCSTITVIVYTVNMCKWILNMVALGGVCSSSRARHHSNQYMACFFVTLPKNNITTICWVTLCCIYSNVTSFKYKRWLVLNRSADYAISLSARLSFMAPYRAPPPIQPTYLLTLLIHNINTTLTILQ